MKIIHCLPWYYPFSTGGSEAYVSALTESQAALGHLIKILVPRIPGVVYPYKHNNIDVEAYDVVEWAGSSPIDTLSQENRSHDDFCIKIRDFDVYHQHFITPSCSAKNLFYAKSMGLKTVYTAHVPGIVCLRGSMLLFGQQPCDGLISSVRCGQCWIHSRGIPLWLAKMVSIYSIDLPPFVTLLSLRRLRSLLRYKKHVKAKKAELKQINQYADCIVTVCRWLYDSIVANGVEPSKLTLSRQGLSPSTLHSLEIVKNHRASLSVLGKAVNVTTRFGFLGRWDTVKGIELAVKAYQRLPPYLSRQLLLAAPSIPSEGKGPNHFLLSAIQSDDTIEIRTDISSESISSFYASIDVLLIPSQWLETGPMVLLEAVAAGIPIIGSAIGGIKELAKIYPGIYLVDPFNIQSWCDAMLAVSSSAAVSIPSSRVRSSDEVAIEMLSLYERSA